MAARSNKINGNEIAVFGGGCFWCTEAIFQRLKGVISVTSGYAGGDTVNPTYQDVSSGTTGHAEVNKIIFDPKVIPFDVLLEIFFNLHDPTTPNRQGDDIGSRYRSVVFYSTAEQKLAVENFIKKMTDDKLYDRPIVTAVKSLAAFYLATHHHQDYYNQNPDQSYCRLVISPKIKKLEEKYAKLLR